jgi:hypothetical protein
MAVAGTYFAVLVRWTWFGKLDRRRLVEGGGARELRLDIGDVKETGKGGKEK